MALVFEAYGALCFFALVVFLAWAAAARLRPDLDEEGFDLAGERSGDAPSIEPAIIEEPSWSPPTRPVKQSRRPLRRGPHVLHTRNPRMSSDPEPTLTTASFRLTPPR